MKIKDLFILNLKTFIIDLIIFIIGIFLVLGFTTVCRAELGIPCPQPPLFYFGLVLIVVSVICFLISLVVLILKKLTNR